MEAVKYLIQVNMTVEAETEEDARYDIGLFISAATLGEQNPIIDYSIEETLETHE